MVSGFILLNSDTRTENVIVNEMTDMCSGYEDKQEPGVYDLVAKISQQFGQHAVKQTEVR
jgi:hypothetical protein